MTEILQIHILHESFLKGSPHEREVKKRHNLTSSFFFNSQTENAPEMTVFHFCALFNEDTSTIPMMPASKTRPCTGSKRKVTVLD